MARTMTGPVGLRKQFNLGCHDARRLGFAVFWKIDDAQNGNGKPSLRVRLVPTTAKAEQACKVASQSSQTTAIEAGVLIDRKEDALKASVDVLTTALDYARQALA